MNLINANVNDKARGFLSRPGRASPVPVNESEFLLKSTITSYALNIFNSAIDPRFSLATTPFLTALKFI